MAIRSGALDQLISGLEDSAEDVSAAAAGALAPAAAAVAGSGRCRLVAGRLWRLLRDQDDLAAPAHAYMGLLAALMALPQAATMLQ